MIKVFYTDISPLSNKTEGFLFSQYRLKRLENISNPQKRKESIAAELLLNYAVVEVFPQLKPPFEITEGECGKPGFKDIPIYFSLSHSGNTVACAVSDTNIGLDVEEGLKYREQVTARFFSKDEQHRILTSDDKGREFARIWTAKESALKYLGVGLHKSTLDVHTAGESVFISPEQEELRVVSYDSEKLVFSVCTKNLEDTIDFKFVEL